MAAGIFSATPKSPARRGKKAEDAVRTFLKGWAERHVGFCYNRILDAHSARGAISNPQAGDFQWFMRTDKGTRNGLIEVKEVQNHRLLPFKNFAPDQVARMRVRQLAGSEPLVLVAHKGKDDRVLFWRAPDFEYLLLREEGRGSWNLEGFAHVLRVEDILEVYLHPNSP